MKKKLASLAFAFLIFFSMSATNIHSKQSGIGRYPMSNNPMRINAFTTQDSSLTLVGRWPYGPCEAVFVKEDYAYIGNGSVMMILDISDPSSPQKIGEVETPHLIKEIFVWGHHAYILDGDEIFRVVDVRDPYAPVEVGYNDAIGRNVHDVSVCGQMAYVCDEDCISLINVSSPTRPFLDETINTGTFVCDAAVLTTSRKYLCIANGVKGFRIFDVTLIMDIVEVGSVDIWYALDVFISGNHAYVVNESSLFIIDLSDPHQPAVVGSYTTEYQLCDVFVSNGYAYVTEFHGRLMIFDVSNPNQPTYEGCHHFDDSEFRSFCVKDQHAYIALGTAGLDIVDVSVPDNPVAVNSYETESSLKSIFVLKDYAYTTTDSGLVVFDVGDPSNPVHHSSMRIDTDTEDIYVFDAYAYIAGSNGLRIVDIGDPENPSVAGVFPTENTVLSVYVKDQYAYVGCSDGLHVIDVTDKSSPEGVEFIGTDYNVKKVIISGDYLYLAGGTVFQVYDISAPAQLVSIGRYDMIHGLVSDVYIADPCAYIAAGGGGLRVVDVSRPENPVEVVTYYEGYHYALDVWVVDNIVYLADGMWNLRVFDASILDNITEITFFESGAYIHDIFVSDSLIYMTQRDIGFCILRSDFMGDPDHIPEQILIMQNYPNPFNSETTIRFELPEPGRVMLKIFDIKGRELETLVDDLFYNSGIYEIEWSADNLPSGVYVYHFHARDYVETKKMILIR